MSTELQLGITLIQCPPAWRNFSAYCARKYPRDGWNRSTEDFRDILNLELKEYRAHAYFGRNGVVKFETERDYSWFLLRWS